MKNKGILAKHIEIGQIGENVTETFLVKHGFAILDRNYRKKWGEIDIVAKKDGVIHFVEVKSVSHPLDVSQETKDSYRPEDNMHPWKIKRLHRAIQTYLMEKDVSGETDWQLDLVAVFLDMRTRKATLRLTENIVI